MSATRIPLVLVLLGVVGVGCTSFAEVPVGGACDLPSGRFVRGYVTKDGEQHLGDGYVRRDESGVVRFSPADSGTDHVFAPGEVKGVLVRRHGRQGGVGAAIVGTLEVVGGIVFYAGLVALDVWLQYEYIHHHH